MRQKIEDKIDEKLQGDAILQNNPLHDQRVLNVGNQNHYFIRKSDFNAPHTYNLNILKPYSRSKIRTFVSLDACGTNRDGKQKQLTHI